VACKSAPVEEYEEMYKEEAEKILKDSGVSGEVKMNLIYQEVVKSKTNSIYILDVETTNFTSLTHGQKLSVLYRLNHIDIELKNAYFVVLPNIYNDGFHYYAIYGEGLYQNGYRIYPLDYSMDVHSETDRRVCEIILNDLSSLIQNWDGETTDDEKLIAHLTLADGCR